jgi:predicted DNA-binding transcriptional regulator AlpA
MTTAAKKKPAAQAALARKAKKLKDEKHESAGAKVRAQLDSDSQKPSSETVPLPKHRRAPIEEARPPPKHARLLSREEVLARVGVSYPTLWTWMRAGNFPRARAMGGRIGWLESEIEEWIVTRPIKRLKGDEEVSR